MRYFVISVFYSGQTFKLWKFRSEHYPTRLELIQEANKRPIEYRGGQTASITEITKDDFDLFDH